MNPEENKMENNNTAPQTPEMSMPAEEAKSSVGPVVGTVIIVIILIVGALYFWKNSDVLQNKDQATNQTEDTVVADLSNVQSSDEISAIEEDLSNTGLEDIDAELSSIEVELNF